MQFKILFFNLFVEFLVLVLISVKGLNTIELCKQYSSESLIFKSFYCVDYCCGNCSFRFCCANETQSIDQDKCINTAGYKQGVSSTRSTIKTQSSSKISKQKSSVPILTETCDSFFDLNYFVQAKKCPIKAQYCCGNCSNRYCCPSPKNRFNQYECKFGSNLTSSDSKKATDSFSYLYVILILVLVLLLAFACIPFVIYINKRSKKFQRSDTTRPFQSIAPLTFLEDLNSTSTQSLNQMPKVVPILNGDDSPPAYTSIYA